MSTKIQKLSPGTLFGPDFFKSREVAVKAIGKALQAGLIRPVYKPMTTRGTPQVRGPWSEDLKPLFHLSPDKICVKFKRI